MLGFAPVSGIPISSLPTTSGAVVRRHRTTARAALAPPPVLVPGVAERATPNHTGESFFYQRRTTRLVQPALFPQNLLLGSASRATLPPTGITFNYNRRAHRTYRQVRFPEHLLHVRVRHAKMPGPPFWLHHNRPHRQAFFPSNLLRGHFFRHRVPGSGLSSLPVHLGNRIEHQPFFPQNLLKGKWRRIFVAEHLEHVLNLEAPDRRHAYAALDSLRPTVPPVADVLEGRQPAGDYLPGRVDEYR